jgi:hypothetical protein
MAAEIADHSARRKTLYLARHPETARGVAGGIASGEARQNPTTDKLSVVHDDEHAAPSFAADTAAKPGLDERAVRLAVRRGENIAPDVLQAVQGTPLRHRNRRSPLLAARPTSSSHE